jgi:hypothetical protein
MSGYYLEAILAAIHSPAAPKFYDEGRKFLLKSFARFKMKKRLWILSSALLAVPVLCAGQTPQPKAVSKKSSAASAKSTNNPTPSAGPSAKIVYAELTIGELIAEDANRWSDKMSAHAAVSGFVTQVAKGNDGDTDVRICENPKIEGMDRARCIVAKCIYRLPCDLPPVGKPVTVKGITRYDAKVGTHWWEIHPVEEVEK